MSKVDYGEGILAGFEIGKKWVMGNLKSRNLMAYNDCNHPPSKLEACGYTSQGTMSIKCQCGFQSSIPWSPNNWTKKRSDGISTWG